MNPGNGTNSGLAESGWCVIGGGNMASAIVLGAIEAGAIVASQFVVVEIDAEKRKFFSDRGVRAVEGAAEGIEALASATTHRALMHILLAVKPQAASALAPRLAEALAERNAPERVVSILAGTPTLKLEGMLGKQARVIRAMPNMPARIRRGTTALACGASCKPGDEKETAELFGALGSVISLDESLFDVFTAIAGSGPAYLFYLAEALVRAGIERGLTAEQSDAIVRSMLAGSADLLQRESSQSATELRGSVTSKGGTTAAATGVLDDAKTMEIFSKAIGAATDRGQELSRG